MGEEDGCSRKMKKDIIKGKVYVLGDNIDTDLIIPACYLNLVPTIPEEYEKLGTYAMAGLPDEYPPFVRPGESKSEYAIVIGGKNFGCGSSREHAPVAMGAAGVRAVVAESYARIFFRNAIATGELYPCESVDRLCDAFRTGEDAELDVAGSSIVQLRTGRRFELRSLGSAAPVVEAGGIFQYARKTGMIG